MELVDDVISVGRLIAKRIKVVPLTLLSGIGQIYNVSFQTVYCFGRPVSRV